MDNSIRYFKVEMNININNKITAVHNKMFTNTIATNCHLLMPAKIDKLNYLPKFYPDSSLNQANYHNV